DSSLFHDSDKLAEWQTGLPNDLIADDEVIAHQKVGHGFAACLLDSLLERAQNALDAAPNARMIRRVECPEIDGGGELCREIFHRSTADEARADFPDLRVHRAQALLHEHAPRFLWIFLERLPRDIALFFRRPGKSRNLEESLEMPK